MDKKETIRHMLANMKDTEIAKELGVSRQYVNNMRKKFGVKQTYWYEKVDEEDINSMSCQQLIEKYGITYYKYSKLKRKKGKTLWIAASK